VLQQRCGKGSDAGQPLGLGGVVSPPIRYALLAEPNSPFVRTDGLSAPAGNVYVRSTRAATDAHDCGISRTRASLTKGLPTPRHITAITLLQGKHWQMYLNGVG
jgi:hypothetical protein